MTAGPSVRHTAARVSIATHGVQGVTCRASRLKAAWCCWVRSALACDALRSSRCEAKSQINRTSVLSCRVKRHRQMASADPRPGLIPPSAPVSLALLGIACRGGNHCPGRRIVRTGHRAGHWRLTARKDHGISDVLLPNSQDNRWTTAREGCRWTWPISTGAIQMHERRRRRAGARVLLDVSARNTDSGFPKAPAPDCPATSFLRASRPVCDGNSISSQTSGQCAIMWLLEPEALSKALSQPRRRSSQYFCWPPQV